MHEGSFAWPTLAKIPMDLNCKSLLLYNIRSFITFGPCMHLNYKHSIFGRVVGGNETLAKMERVPTDKEDRPTVRKREV